QTDDEADDNHADDTHALLLYGSRVGFVIGPDRASVQRAGDHFTGAPDAVTVTLFVVSTVWAQRVRSRLCGVCSMSQSSEYQPPKVWTWEQPSGGQFASINRPVSGPTHERELPVGRHPLQLYSQGTPNGVKVTILLEELLAQGHAGAEYDAWLIRIGDGDQFGSGFVGVNPNSKIPALMDRSGPAPIRVFESGAILTYLAEKFGAFLPTAPAARAECLSWLFWQVGSAPYLGGGFGHFYAYAPVKIEYAINRFTME